MLTATEINLSNDRNIKFATLSNQLDLYIQKKNKMYLLSVYVGFNGFTATPNNKPAKRGR